MCTQRVLALNNRHRSKFITDEARVGDGHTFVNMMYGAPHGCNKLWLPNTPNNVSSVVEIILKFATLSGGARASVRVVKCADMFGVENQ